MDSRADRAKIASLVCRVLSGILLGRGRFRRRYACDGRAACALFEMDVSERKDKLQRHRCKRQPTPTPPSGPSPTHWQNALTHACDSLHGSRYRANTFRSNTLLASINRLNCCLNVTARGWPTLRPVASILQANRAFCDFLPGRRRDDGAALSGPKWVCAVTRRCFPVGANPTRRMLQPEAAGAAMEVTK